jgi:hypothetical protein
MLKATGELNEMLDATRMLLIMCVVIGNCALSSLWSWPLHLTLRDSFPILECNVRNQKIIIAP